MPDIREAFRVRVVAMAAPGAGAQFVKVNDSGSLWRVRTAAFQLVTSAVAGNRSVSLTVDDGSDVYWQACAGNVQAASLTQQYGAFPGAPGASSGAQVLHIALPIEGVWMEAGAALRTVTALFDVGDAFTKGRLLVEEYPQGPFEADRPISMLSREEW